MIVSADIPTASAKKGAVRTTSAYRKRPRSHHAHNSSTKGSTTVDGLLSMAASPQAMASAYQPGFLSASDRKKHNTARKKNSPDCVFFSSVIHAPDSTLTGWSTHNMAANHG